MASLLLAPASAASADGHSASAAGMAHAMIIEPLTVHEIAPLQFGTIAVGPGKSGAITVDPTNGMVTYGGGLEKVCSSNTLCEASPALFGVNGEANRAYRVEVPSAATAFHSGTGFSLPVDSINVSVESAGGGEEARGLLDAAGRGMFRVGGTLRVPVDSPSGKYRANLKMVVTYD